MSLDPNTLKKGERVKFGETIIREVEYVSVFERKVSFCDKYTLYFGDPLWKLAELVGLKLPSELFCTILGDDDKYFFNGRSHSPGEFLSILKRDAARLEAAGVKEEEEE